MGVGNESCAGVPAGRDQPHLHHSEIPLSSSLHLFIFSPTRQTMEHFVFGGQILSRAETNRYISNFQKQISTNPDHFGTNFVGLTPN